MKQKKLKNFESSLRHTALNNQINNNEIFPILLYYFFSSSTKDLNFSNWSKNFICSIQNSINEIFIDYEKNCNDKYSSLDDLQGLLGFISISKINNSINEKKYDDYFNLIKNIDSKKYPLTVNLLNNILKIISIIQPKLLEKYYPEYQPNFLKDFKNRELLRELSYRLIIENNKLQDEICNLSDNYMYFCLNKKSYTLEKDKKYNSEITNLNFEKSNNEGKIYHLYDVINGSTIFNSNLFKKSLSSNKKGIIGEKLFSASIGGTVVGNLGNKEDVILDSDKYSVKTTYRNIWNHHLAYISDREVANLFLSDKKLSSFKNKVENFNDLILSFFIGNSKLTSLVLQTIQMDELNNTIISSTQYSIPIKNLELVINNKSYIFNNNDLLLIHNDEQFLKISFKERAEILQIMLSTTIENLETLVNSGFANKEQLLQEDIKRKKIKI